MTKSFIAAICALTVLFSAPALASVFETAHDYQYSDTNGPIDRGMCEVCHVPHAPSSTNGNTRWDELHYPIRGLDWKISVQGQLCGTCHGIMALQTFPNKQWQIPHRVDNLYSPMSHGRVVDVLQGAKDRSLRNIHDKPTNAAARPYFGAEKWMECTSCHNVHNNKVRPFLRYVNVTNSISDFCIDCHDRGNGDGKTAKLGKDNVFKWNGANHSMHPVNIPYKNSSGSTILLRGTDVPPELDTQVTPGAWRLGPKLEQDTRNIGCGTCHAIHGTSSEDGMDNRPAVYPYLLAMDNEPKTSDGANDRSPLCEACHVGHNKNNRKARSASDHPVDQIIGGKEVIDNWQHTRAYESMYYIGSGGNALADWKPNDGAVRWPYAPADTGSPVPGIDHGTKANAAIVCTSCHSAHGGRPGTSLLREVFGCATGAKMPQEDINRSIITDDWCFSCHSVGAE